MKITELSMEELKQTIKHQISNYFAPTHSIHRYSLDTKLSDNQLILIIKRKMGAK